MVLPFSFCNLVVKIGFVLPIDAFPVSRAARDPIAYVVHAKPAATLV
jgi:hypothetical protein